MKTKAIANNASLIGSIADLLRGDFKQSEYGKIILPFTILRRLDCLLEKTRDAVLDEVARMPEDIDDEIRMGILCAAADAGGQIYNESRFTFASLRHEVPELHTNLVSYLDGFSPNIRDIFLEKFKFTEILKELDSKDLLRMVFDRFCQADLHPDNVSNLEMGYLFEELVRRFSEISNETAGEHFTPREVVRLLVDLLLANDEEALSEKGVIRRIYDPACGTGGMLSVADETIRGFNDRIRVEMFGQELNGESFAVCTSDMLVKNHDVSRIAHGNTLTDDAHFKEFGFHYMLSNPPYGVDWKKYAPAIRQEAEDYGYQGRFGAGLPRISDGQLLFLQHMISKMRDDDIGSRIGIVMNGSPLFTGGAGSGESEIRRWMLENDWVDAIIALPSDLFYNTGIQTYIWILSNRKPEHRQSKVQLIDAGGKRFWSSMRKSLGSKRREISDEARADILRLYCESMNGGSGHDDVSRIFETTDFGYREIRVERPLRLRMEITRDLLDELRDNEKSMKALALAGKKIDFTNALLVALAKKQGKSWTDTAAFRADLVKIMAKRGNSLTDVALELLIDRFGTPDGTIRISKDLLDQLHADRKFMTTLIQACQDSGSFTDILFGLLKARLANVRMDRAVFLDDLAMDMAGSRIKMSASGIKLLVNHFGEAHEDAEICRDKNGVPEPDPKLRDHEIVPLLDDWREYMKREVIPFVPDAWVDETYVDVRDGKIGRVGYEINFNRYFYKYVPPRPLEEIDAELFALENEIAGLLKEMAS